MLTSKYCGQSIGNLKIKISSKEAFIRHRFLKVGSGNRAMRHLNNERAVRIQDALGSVITGDCFCITDFTIKAFKNTVRSYGSLDAEPDRSPPFEKCTAAKAVIWHPFQASNVAEAVRERPTQNSSVAEAVRWRAFQNCAAAKPAR